MFVDDITFEHDLKKSQIFKFSEKNIGEILEWVYFFKHRKVYTPLLLNS